MARRALRLASWTSMALAASGLCLYSNKYLDPNDFGAVRVGRAVATVGIYVYFSFGAGEELQYCIQVFIHVADGYAGHMYVEIQMYSYMRRAPATPLPRHACIPSHTDQHSCMHNFCRPVVEESGIAQDHCFIFYFF